MNVQATLNVTHNTTKAELLEAMEPVPGNAKVRISSYTADRPGETSYSTVTFSWEI